MDESGKKHPSSLDKNDDGVRITEHGSQGSGSVLFYKWLALALVGCVVFYFVNMAIDRTSNNDDKTHSASSISETSELQNVDENDIASASSSTAGNRPHQQRVAGPAQAYDSNDLSHYVAAGETPKMEEVIQRLHDAGIHTGLGAFNPPGTSPPMIGIAVPENYVLPEGYVRHYQATDDGQRIEPILMYSPDFQFFDENGRLIPIPENRVVPGNLVPPGLAIRPIQIPEPLEPGGP